MIQNILTAITGLIVFGIIVYRLVRLWRRRDDAAGGCSGCTSRSDCSLKRHDDPMR
ncbi:FeoB-associated Cys-rich membrane protein [Porphyromonas loveana]|uniref:FeoB-associated Cys-rich membrane protein n=1 Tax=Porphyromonas loveana TaxID=1884669 RepID=UPI00359FEB15